MRHGLSPAELLCPVVGASPASLSINTADYLQMLDSAGRALAPGRRGRIAEGAPAVLAVIDRDAPRWAMRVSGYGGGWARAAGCAQDLIDLAARIGQRWLQGVRLAWWLS